MVSVDVRGSVKGGQEWVFMVLSVSWGVLGIREGAKGFVMGMALVSRATRLTI